MPKKDKKIPLIQKIDWKNLSFYLVTPDDIKRWSEEYGQDILFQVDHRGFTSIHWASFLGLKDIVEHLIQNGVPVNSKAETAYKPQPIHLASMEGHLEVIDTLIANGADVNARDEFGCTPLMRAVMAGSIRTRNSVTLLHLLCRGADPYLTDSLKFHVLHYATIKEDEESVNLLLTIGIDPNIRAKSGLKPLHLAYYTGNYRLVRKLSEVTRHSGKPKRLRAHKSLMATLSDAFDLAARFFVASSFIGAICFVYPVYVFRVLPETADYPIIHIILMSSSVLIWYFWDTTWSIDPGFVATNTVDYHKIMDAKLAVLGRPSDGKFAPIPHSDVQLCHTCRIVQPDRSKHCFKCGRCVLLRDHHCIYLNNCIGANNRVVFVWLTLNLCITGLLLCLMVYQFVQQSGSGWDKTSLALLFFAIKLHVFGAILTFCIIRRAGLDVTQSEEALRWRGQSFRKASKRGKSSRSLKFKLKNLIKFFTGKKNNG